MDGFFIHETIEFNKFKAERANIGIVHWITIDHHRTLVINGF